MSKQIYMIFYDRGYRAQDNGEHLCRWVINNHPEIKTAYILNSTSYDWIRLKEEGFNLIDCLDKEFTHNELLKCDYVCSSIFNEGINLNFEDCKCKRIFLNHGCFLVPIKYIKDEAKNIDLFIAANKIEYDTLLDPYHGLSFEQVALCGQPRQDDLVKAQKADHVENTILIQFWQRPKDWTKNNNEQFLKSDFYKKTKALLKNNYLLKVCKDKNIKIIFKMHPIQYDWLKYYKCCENNIVKISPISEPFEPEFIRSKLIITDISSNAYEMAKINKPCIYFEPDSKELFEWRFKKNGGFEFDLKNNSIGPVIEYSVSALIKKLIEIIKADFVLDDLYINRRKEQISFLNDTNNCKRCFEAIMTIQNTVSKCAVKAIEKKKKEEKKLNKFSEDGLPLIEESLFW